MAAAHYLPETSPPVEMTSHIAAAKVGAEEDWPRETSNQDQNGSASLHTKKQVKIRFLLRVAGVAS